MDLTLLSVATWIWSHIDIVLFYSIIILFFVKKRHKIERQGVFILYRTKRGLKWISNFVKKHRKFWKYFGRLSMYVGFAGIVAVLILLGKKALEILSKPSAQAGVALAVPGIKIPGSPIFIPFWYGIISLIIVLVVHEGCHGLVAKAHKIKLKSAGIGLLAFLPLAFVEPDEKQLEKAPLKTRLSVFGAGPLANLSVALIALVISMGLAPVATSLFEPSGLDVVGVTEGLPADKAGLETGAKIVGVNNITTESIQEFSQEMNKVEPGENITLLTKEEEILITTTHNPDNKSQSYIGVSFTQARELKEGITNNFGGAPWLLVHLLELLRWIFALNLGIGAINLLPLGPIDGGRMLKDTLKEKMKNQKLAKRILKVVSYFSLFLLIINIIGPYLMSI